MKIAYLSFENPEDLSGIGVKIKSQMSEWKKNGHMVKHFSLREFAVKRHKNPTLNLFFNCKILQAEINQFHPDAIYMREILYFPGIEALKKVAPVIMEINSDALVEYKQSSYLKYLYHTITRKLLFSCLSAFVSVSRELAERDLKQFGKPVCVIANGYDFNCVTAQENSPDKRISFIFVSSPSQLWSGIDEIEKLANKLSDCLFHIICAGYVSTIQNIRAYDGLYGDQLHQLYKMSDVGIGTLALYRKKMGEASPLKTREYLAYGLPVIIAYKDTDLDELLEADGVLKLPNLPDAAANAADKIKEFAIMWKGRRIPPEKMAPYISYEVKERERLKFISQVINCD